MTYSILGKDENGNTIQVNQGARREGMYIIGASGTGKSTLIQSLVLQDIEQGLGVCLLDPHGDLTNRILESMTKRVEDVILLDVANDQFPFGLNLFSCPYPNDIRWVQYTVNQVMHIFDRLYNITRDTPNMSYFLRNCTYTIIANPGYTMAEIPILLTNELFRRKLLANVTEQRVVRFWSEYERITKSRYEYNNTVLPILNKLDEFLQPMLLHIVGQSKSTINLRQIMDSRKLLFVKLDPRLEDMTTLIGSVIVAQVLNAAYSRGELLQNKRPQMNLYCDEFEWFAGEDFMQLVSEARKFGIGTTVSNQTLSQIPDPIKENILQAATLVVFRVSGQDGEELATEFSAVPPPAETRREAVLVPKQNVIDHLLNNGHPNKKVGEFVQQYLEKISRASQEPFRPGRQIESLNERYEPEIIHEAPQKPFVQFENRDEEYAYMPNEIKKSLGILNSLLYYWNSIQLRGSLEQPTYKALEQQVYKGFSEVLGFYHYYLSQYEPMTTEGKNALIQLRKLENLADDTIKQAAPSNISEEKRDSLMRELDAIHDRKDYYIDILDKEAIPIIVDALRKQIALDGQISRSDGFFPSYGSRNFFYLYKPSEDTILRHAQNIYDHESYRFQKFSSLLRRIETVLAVEPILTESGRFEDKPLAPRPIADVEKEVAKFLSSPLQLPTFTAYVKTPTGEHKIAISRSTAGMSRVAFNERIHTIFQNNYIDRYIRPVAGVTKEIMERQTLPAPQPIQKPPVQPTDKKSERYSYLQPAEGGSTWEDPSELEETSVISIISQQKPIQTSPNLPKPMQTQPPAPPPQVPPLPPSRRRKPR